MELLELHYDYSEKTAHWNAHEYLQDQFTKNWKTKRLVCEWPNVISKWTLQLKEDEVIMCCLVSAATQQRVQWYRSMEKCCILEQTFEMLKAKLYGHSNDNALCADTIRKTTHLKVWQLTDSGYQDLQHHWLIPDRFLKTISDTICTTTARTNQQDCHYCSLLQLSVATTIIILSTHLRVTFMANTSISMCELYNSQPALCFQIFTVCGYK